MNIKREDLPSNLKESFNSKIHFTRRSIENLNFFDMTANIEYEFAYLKISDVLFKVAWINEDTHQIEYLSEVFNRKEVSLIEAMKAVIDNWLKSQTGKYDYLAEIQIMDETELAFDDSAICC